jgi:uncharacterized protein YqeY
MLHQNIKEQIKEAMRAKDSLRLDTLRGLNAAFLNEMIANPSPQPSEFLSDDKALTIVKRSVKQRKDSIEQFQKGGREDLAEKEKAELQILESFMPKMMSREEIKPIVEKRIMELRTQGGLDAKASGKLVGMFMKEFSGKADGSDVKAVVEEAIKI